MDITNSTIALITGASSGIGAALAIMLAGYGAKVAIAARRRERLEAVAEQIRAAGGTPLVIQADFSKKADAEQAVRTTIATFGGIDILVNNAGRGNVASIEDTTQEQLDSLFSLNVYSLWYTTAIALPVMKQQGRGHIINISSMAGKSAFPGSSVYIATKHACVGFTAALRSELMGTGVEATVICPVNVKTEWASATEGGSVEELFAVALGSIAQAEHHSDPPPEASPSLIEAVQKMGVVLSPQAVVETIIATIQNPTKADVFTHPGSEAVALAIAHDRRVVEGVQQDFILAMQQAYTTLHKS
ncbi:MAG: SDR family oxidoreductase [Leptolyngbyaceae cyanobacterium bins.302]|nr:SDR family oxidoreductase [Leptolyngbyaceae cyanobacterium bins.302]